MITPCSAAPYDEASLQDSLPVNARNLAGEATQPASEGLERIESAFTRNTVRRPERSDKALLSIIAVAIICAVLTMFCDDAPEYVSLGGCAAIAIISVSDVNSFVSSGADVITALSGLFKNIAACNVCSVSRVRNSVLSNAVKYAASVLFFAFCDNSSKRHIAGYTPILQPELRPSSFGSKSLKDISALLKRACTLFNDCGSPRLHCVYK